MPSPNQPTTSQEIDRDHALVLCDLLRNLGRLFIHAIDTLLLGGPTLDLPDVQDQITALLEASSQHRRRLNDGRINRRGDPSRPAETAPPVPEAARPFLRHGDYLGSYPTLQAFTARTLGLGGIEATNLARLDLTGLGLDMHLHGIVWTITADGQLHAFRPRPPHPRESP